MLITHDNNRKPDNFLQYQKKKEKNIYWMEESHEISTIEWQSSFKTVWGRGDYKIRYHPYKQCTGKTTGGRGYTVGPGGMVDGKEVTMQVKEGQKVIYSKYAGTEVKLDGEEYIIVRQNDILAVVE